MAKQEKSVHKKSMGRPPGIKYGGTIPARFELPAMEALNEWAVRHKVSRSEAIRRLVELGLTVKTRPTQSGHTRAERAKELAGQAIDKMGDPAALPAERTQRRHSLTKGPEEFRGVRVDRPKTKGSSK